jgi:hypothetical protein
MIQTYDGKIVPFKYVGAFVKLLLRFPYRMHTFCCHVKTEQSCMNVVLIFGVV